MNKIKNYLTYIIIATFPIMSIINIGSISKFNLALSDIFIVVLGIIWIIDIRNFKLKKNYPYFWYFTALIIVFLVSNVHALNSNIVSSGVSGIISEALKFIISAVYLFVGYNSCKDEKDLKNVLKSWLFGLWIFMIYGLYAHLSALNNISFWRFNNSLDEHIRFLGTITDPNAAGTYLTLSFFIVLLFINITDNKKDKILGYCTEILVVICILLTQSRGSWLGFGFGLGLLILFNIKKIYKFVIFIIPISIILFFGFVIIDNETNNIISDNFVNRVEEVTDGGGQFIVRTGLTKIAIDMGMDNFILGVGRGNFTLNSKPYADEIYDKRDDFIYHELIRSLPHTTFIGMFAELGILGFLTFSSIFVLLFYKFFKNWRTTNNILLFALLAFGVQSFGLNLENFRGLWIFIGIFLIILDNNIDTIVVKYKNEIYIKNFYKIFALSMLIAFIVYIYAARKIPEHINLDNNNIYSTNILIEQNQNPIKLVYYIKGSVNIKVYDDSQNLVIDKGYVNVDGFVKTELFPEEKTKKYNIIFEGQNEKVSTLKNLYYVENNKIYSLIDYKYIPNFITKLLNGTPLMAHDNYDIKNNNEAQYPIDFGDYKILNGKINNVDGYSEIEFDIELKNLIKKDSILNVTYSNNDISNMPNRQNKLIEKYSIKDITKDMMVGDKITYTIKFKGENAIYDVNVNIENKNFYLGQANPNSVSLANYLNKLDENKLIMLAIMDEGTINLDYNSIYELKKFGLNADLIDKSRYAYIVVASKSHLVNCYENLSDVLIQKEFAKGDKLGEYALPFNLNIISAGLQVGNIASIVIDGIEYSNMQRGMNIVVYDMITNKVVDSINFDTYTSIYK